MVTLLPLPLQYIPSLYLWFKKKDNPAGCTRDCIILVHYDLAVSLAKRIMIPRATTMTIPEMTALVAGRVIPFSIKLIKAWGKLNRLSE